VKLRPLYLLLAAAFAAAVAGAFFVGRARGPGEGGSPPAVVLAVHDLAQLESTSFHMEKVVEVSEAQSHLWGLVEAHDAILLVAVGDVVAGVDLSKLGERDVSVDAETHTLRLHLPPATILHTVLDEGATHVYQRSTDVLAQRNEQLEGAARARAQEAILKAAVDAGILDRARKSAEQTLRALSRSMGYEHAEIDWSDRG
jgi:hypothetical protein